MPHFCSNHHPCGDYICQVCATIHCEMCDGKKSYWMKIPNKSFRGNVCPKCVERLEAPISLFEHCRKESGLTDPDSINRYMQRHYGHG
jgi:hypothetical protein